jgi:protein-tyrosine kinase
MSLIEQAAKRLAQLRKAGVDGDSFDGAEPRPLAAQAELAAVARVAGDCDLKRQRAGCRQARLALAECAAASRRIEIDLNALATSGLISPDAPRSQIADQYRVIKRPLIANAMGKGAAPIKRGNLIMVTSAMPAKARVSRRSIWR